MSADKAYIRAWGCVSFICLLAAARWPSLALIAVYFGCTLSFLCGVGSGIAWSEDRRQ